VIPALRRLRQGDHMFKANLDYTMSLRASLGYLMRLCLTKQRKTERDEET
jgi:hypothetical protein